MENIESIQKIENRTLESEKTKRYHYSEAGGIERH